MRTEFTSPRAISYQHFANWKKIISLNYRFNFAPSSNFVFVNKNHSCFFAHILWKWTKKNAQNAKLGQRWRKIILRFRNIEKELRFHTDLLVFSSSLSVLRVITTPVRKSVEKISDEKKLEEKFHRLRAKRSFQFLALSQFGRGKRKKYYNRWHLFVINKINWSPRKAEGKDESVLLRSLHLVISSCE